MRLQHFAEEGRVHASSVSSGRQGLPAIEIGLDRITNRQIDALAKHGQIRDSSAVDMMST